MKNNPIIIGGTGGSGTRLVQTIIEKQKVFLGEDLNAERDLKIMGEFLEANINTVLEITRSLNYKLSDLPADIVQKISEDLNNVFKKFHSSESNEFYAWGFKNPRSIYMLPFYYNLYPELRFVHVIRDGRDVAISSNRNQSIKHYSILFNDNELNPDSSDASIKLWAKTNFEVSKWCEENIGDNYIPIRYEDLCNKPDNEILNLLTSLNLPIESDNLQLIGNKEAIGRYKALSGEEIDRLTELGAETLIFFGYL